MRSYITMRRILATASLGALAAAACVSYDEALSVTDPDIINPSDVQSPAGADAVRLGALARLNSATSGDESLFLLGGLLADEWRSGDSFIARDEIDQRQITIENSFLTTANRVLHRTRISGEQAIQLLKTYSVNAPSWQLAEMYFVRAFVENLMGEDYCNGLVFSTVVDGVEQLGTPTTTTAAFQLALTHADSGLALITAGTASDLKIKYALQVIKGRILLNLNQQAAAAAAVAGVPTSFKYEELQSQTTRDNATWSLNNSIRRYNVSAGEGPGPAFATAKDPRLPVCVGGDAACRAAGVTQTRPFDNTTVLPFYAQLLWPTRESSVTIASGIEARLIEAEAQLKAGNNSGALATLNAARTTVTGLTPLTDAGSEAARVDQLFRERGFWMFGTGHRLGDLRRLIRQYNRSVSSVFPTGSFHKGGQYGPDVNFPVPQAEQNNPNVPAGTSTCIDRNA